MNKSSACAVCHKPLENPESLLLGIGPVCRKKSLVDRIARKNHGDLFDAKAVIYDFWMEIVEGVKVLLIVDLSNDHGGRTVTNSADEVLDEIFHVANELPNMVVYKDSDSSWTRMLIDDKGKFMGFAPLEVGKDGNDIKDTKVAKVAAQQHLQQAA